MKKYTVDFIRTTADRKILVKVLKRGKNDLVSCYAADNPNCPPEILSEVLKRGKNDNVSWCTASNPNCPPEALGKVLKRGNNDTVSCRAAENSNCPPGALIKVLKRGNNDWVSWNAACNLKYNYARKNKIHSLIVYMKKQSYTRHNLKNLLKQF